MLLANSENLTPSPATLTREGGALLPSPIQAMPYPHLLKPCRGKAFAFYVVGYTKIFLRECFALNLGNHALAWKGESVALFEERASAFGEKNSGFCF
jgi:hypothetical protein